MECRFKFRSVGLSIGVYCRLLRVLLSLLRVYIRVLNELLQNNDKWFMGVLVPNPFYAPFYDDDDDDEYFMDPLTHT